jgi:hypothetical protein
VLVTARPPREAGGTTVGRHLLEGACLGLLAGCAGAFVNGRRRRALNGAVELQDRLPASVAVMASGRSVPGHRAQDLVGTLVRRLPTGGVVAVAGIRDETDLAPALEIARAVQRARYRTVVAVWPHAKSGTRWRGPVTFGMAELLLSEGRDAIDFATLVDDVWVIGPGEATRLAAADTGRRGVREAMRRLHEDTDYVLVQATGPRAHLSLTVRAADAVVVVAQDRVTTATEITNAVRRIGPDRVAGVVLTPAPGAAALRAVRLRLRRSSATAAEPVGL